MPDWGSASSFADWFIDTVGRFGLEQVVRRFYGTYRAVVEDIDDPDDRGRVRVRVPALGQKVAPENIWAWPMLPAGSMKHGMYFVPEVGDQVWVQFEGGHPDRPILSGGFLAIGQRPAQFDDVLKRGISTAQGHFIRFSDVDGDMHVTLEHKDGASLVMDDGGGVTMQAKSGGGQHKAVFASGGDLVITGESGAEVKMTGSATTVTHKDGTEIKLDGAVTITSKGKVTIKGPGECVVSTATVKLAKGATDAVVHAGFKMLFDNHSHIGNLGAPVSPPAAMGMMMIPGVHMSSKVKVAK